MTHSNVKPRNFRNGSSSILTEEEPGSDCLSSAGPTPVRMTAGRASKIQEALTEVDAAATTASHDVPFEEIFDRLD
jgi:hypothetical protein